MLTTRLRLANVHRQKNQPDLEVRQYSVQESLASKLCVKQQSSEAL